MDRFNFGRVLRRAGSLYPRLLKLVLLWRLVSMIALWLFYTIFVYFSIVFFFDITALPDGSPDGSPDGYDEYEAVLGNEYEAVLGNSRLFWFLVIATTVTLLLLILLIFGCMVASGLKVANGDSWSFGEALRYSASRYGTLMLWGIVQCSAKFLLLDVPMFFIWRGGVAVGLGLLCLLIVPGILLTVLFYTAPVEAFTSDASPIGCLGNARKRTSRFLGAVTAEVVLVKLVLWIFNIVIFGGYFFFLYSTLVISADAPTEFSPWRVRLFTAILPFIPYFSCFTDAAGLANRIAVHTELSEWGEPLLPST